MSLKSQSPNQVFEWPSWAIVYAYTVAIPLAFISLGLGILIAYDYSYLFSVGSAGSLLLLIAFLLSFVMGGILFAVGAQRVLTNQSEALTFTASGHLMILLPTLTILLVEFSRYQTRFISELNTAMTENHLSIEFVFMIWLVIHAYFALFLSFADNTTRFIDFE